MMKYFLHDCMAGVEMISEYETEEALVDGLRTLICDDEKYIEQTKILIADGFYLEADGNHHLYANAPMRGN